MITTTNMIVDMITSQIRKTRRAKRAEPGFPSHQELWAKVGDGMKG
jgi:hypothetical protein